MITNSITYRSLLIVLVGTLSVGSSYSQESRMANGEPVEWPSFEGALEAAAKTGKTVLIDVFAPTCPWCRKMQAEVYTDVELQKYLYKHFELGRIDISIDSDTVRFKGYELSSAQLGSGFGATGTPTTIFMMPNGDYITRLPGYHALEGFSDVLKYVGSESYKDMSYTEYLEKQ